MSRASDAANAISALKWEGPPCEATHGNYTARWSAKAQVQTDGTVSLWIEQNDEAVRPINIGAGAALSLAYWLVSMFSEIPTKSEPQS